MRTAFEHGLAGVPWGSPEPHAHVRRAVGYLGWTQVETGHGCPVTMTYAAVPALRAAPELAERYEPGLTAPAYEFGLAEPTGKRGLVAGKSEEHTSELQSRQYLVCRLLLEKK